MMFPRSNSGSAGSLGPFKLQFNSDVNKLKKYFVQARTHIINAHAKKLKKFKNRAENPVLKEMSEKKTNIMIEEIKMIKKLKFRDIVKFFMLNEIELSKVMNTPIVTQDKVAAKIAAYKSFNPKLQEIKDKYRNFSMVELLKPKLKKNKRKKDGIESKSADKNIPEKKINDKIKSSNVRSTSSFDVEDLESSNKIVDKDDDSESGFILNLSKSDNSDMENDDESDVSQDREIQKSPVSSNKKHKESCIKFGKIKEGKNIDNDNIENFDLETSDSENISLKRISKGFPEISDEEIDDSFEFKEFSQQKIKESSDGFKLAMENSLDDDSDAASEVNIDPFFKTASRDDYVTSASRRLPDETKKMEGDTRNRKMRRAALFGRNIVNNKTKTQRRNLNTNFKADRDRKGDDRVSIPKFPHNNRESSGSASYKRKEEPDTSKLHPSWEAKKQKSSIVQFQGNKTVFD